MDMQLFANVDQELDFHTISGVTRSLEATVSTLLF